MRSLRYEPSASVCALMVATPGLVGWSRIRPVVGEPSRAPLGAAGAASPKTRDGGDFGGSTAGGGAGAITPPGTLSALRVLPDAFEPPGRHGSSLGTEPQLRVLPVASDFLGGRLHFEWEAVDVDWHGPKVGAGALAELG